MDGFDSSIEKVDDKFPYRRVDVAYTWMAWFCDHHNANILDM